MVGSADDRKPFEDALEFWREERERVYLEIGAYRDGLLRVERREGSGWVEITQFWQEGQFTRLRRISEIVDLLEEVLNLDDKARG